MKKAVKYLLHFGFLLSATINVAQSQNTPEFDVLVFTKTAGFTHGSIPEAKDTFAEMASSQGFTAVFTENANDFNDAYLAEFEAVLFLLTSGDVLNLSQQTAFEAYIRNGGGYMGVHSASDTEYSWPWYGQLVGSYFDGHPAIQDATVIIEDSTHPSSLSLPATWERRDEWYNFQTNPRDDEALDINVLLTVDESSYNGGQMGADHPISWYHEFDGGRSWYTGMGHTDASYADDDFKAHLLGGLLYAAGVAPADPVVVDESGQWFKKQNSGQPYFMAGVGGPEGYLYETNARRQEIVDDLVASGANALYMHSIRTFEGDGFDFEDPFVINNDASSGIRPGVFAEWRGFLNQLDAAGIVTWMHVIDDTARPWGCDVPLSQDAKDYIAALVSSFRDLDHLVWLSGEEYLMGSCTDQEDKALMEAIAAEIKLHDPIHPIGVHHNNTQEMQFGGDPNINVFAQQICGNDNDRSPEGVHARARPGDWVYVMAECHPWHLNLLHDNDRTNIRQSNWGTALGGGYTLLYNAYECSHGGRLCSRNPNGNPGTGSDPHDPSAAILGDLNRIKNFMLSSRFNEISPDDSLVTGDSLWSSANTDDGLYVLYAKDSPQNMGVSGLLNVNHRLNWFNPLTGERVTEEALGSLSPFTVPASMGTEVALFIERIGDVGNRAPMAFMDNYQTAVNQDLTVLEPGILMNDSDPDGDPLTAILIDDVTSGDLTFNADGGFVYSPLTDAIGTVSFTYQANDGELNSLSTSVNIQVGTPTIQAVLVNSLDDMQVITINNGAMLNATALGLTEFSIEATAVPEGTNSVRLELSGPITQNQVEGIAPYALFGDTVGDFAGMPISLGEYTLEVTAYDQTGGNGTVLASKEIIFSFILNNDLIFADGFE